MNDLLARAVAAHGGLVRWSEFSWMTVTIVSGGGLWPMKGPSRDSNPREQTIMFHEETASVSPFGQPDWRTASVDLPDDAILDGHAWVSRSKKSRPGKKLRILAQSACGFQTRLPAIAKSRISILARISGCVGMITASTWRADFWRRNMSMTSWKSRGSASRPSVAPICAGPI